MNVSNHLFVIKVFNFKNNLLSKPKNLIESSNVPKRPTSSHLIGINFLYLIFFLVGMIMPLLIIERNINVKMYNFVTWGKYKMLSSDQFANTSFQFRAINRIDINVRYFNK